MRMTDRLYVIARISHEKRSNPTHLKLVNFQRCGGGQNLQPTNPPSNETGWSVRFLKVQRMGLLSRFFEILPLELQIWIGRG